MLSSPNYALKEELVAGWGNSAQVKKIVVIPIRGMIVDEESPRSLFSAQGVTTSTSQIERYAKEIRKDRSVAGVLLDVNSPGGGAAASDNIYNILKGVGIKKPVVAYIESVGASGAYYVSCAAQLIFASRAALVGSISVVSQLMQVKGLMEKLGVRAVTLTTGPYKAAGSPHEELTPEHEAYLRGILNYYHNLFVSVVHGERASKMDKAGAAKFSKQMDEIASGKIFSAQRAHELGLVDLVTDQLTALVETARLCGDANNAVFVRYREQVPMPPMFSLLQKFLGAHSSHAKGDLAETVEQTLDLFGLLRPQGPLYLWQGFGR